MLFGRRTGRQSAGLGVQGAGFGEVSVGFGGLA